MLGQVGLLEKLSIAFKRPYVYGKPATESFVIRNKPIKVAVPDKGPIQVKGIRGGSFNGITYAVFFNKTGKTYLNIVLLNAINIYTIKTNY